jgi:hypothetical protein
VLHRVREQRNILHEIRRRKANWIGHILRKHCLLDEGKTDEGTYVMGRRRRRRKQLLDDFKGTRGYWKQEEDALYDTVWRTHFGSGYGRVVRQTAE